MPNKSISKLRTVCKNENILQLFHQILVFLVYTKRQNVLKYEDEIFHIGKFEC